jgi:hypothetical protein
MPQLEVLQQWQMQFKMETLSMNNPRNPTGIAGAEPPLGISGTTSESGPILVTDTPLIEIENPNLLLHSIIDISNDQAIGTKILDLRTHYGLVPPTYVRGQFFVNKVFLPIQSWPAFYSSMCLMEYDLIFQFAKVQDCRMMLNLSVNYNDQPLTYGVKTMVNHTVDIYADSVNDNTTFPIPQYFLTNNVPNRPGVGGTPQTAPFRNIYIPKTRVSGFLALPYTPNDMQPLKMQVIVWLRLKPVNTIGYSLPASINNDTKTSVNLPYWMDWFRPN